MGRHFHGKNPLRRTTALLGAVAGFAAVPHAGADEVFERGKVIYGKLCTECHGANGEGGDHEDSETLYGDRSIPSLAKRITKTMPEDDPDLCVGEDAEAVAHYIHAAFYSPVARAKLSPAKRQLSRLTANQFRVSVSDAIGFFRGGIGVLKTEERGLKGTYWGGSNFGNSTTDGKQDEKTKMSFERRDAGIVFDFGEGTPDDTKFDPGMFSSRWEGSLLVEESGTYEFMIRTRNGARLFLNDTVKTPLINTWVSSGEELREEKVSTKLLGGRAYPLKMEYFKHRQKLGLVELLWKAPNGVWEPIPERSLAPETVWKEVFVPQTDFPADDRSDGYERGTSISKEWLSAVNRGALEAGDHVFVNFQKMTGCKPEERDNEAGVAKIRDFVRMFASLAYRKPVGEEEAGRLLGGEFTPAGVKKAVVATLTSPRFLYPDFSEPDATRSHQVAGRLALSMWDSLPDKELWKQAEQGKLEKQEQVRKQAERMLRDPRTRNKLRGFFHDWLELKDADNMVKSPERFPGIDGAVLADLRTSLDLFIDDVTWGDDSDYRKLLTADYLYLNERLSDIYGKGVKGAAFRKTVFEDGTRSGIITHPYMLTSLAYYDNTSPIHRGVFLTRNIVGRMLKMPPDATEFKDSDFDPSLTMREKVTNLTKSNACMACHTSINPLGFSLERFDAVGRWRDTDNGKPINTISDFYDDNGEKVPIAGPKDVAEFAIGSESARQAFVHRLFNHMVKQPIAANSSAGLQFLEKRFSENGYSIRNLVVESVMIDAMRGTDPASGDTVAK